MSEYPQQLVRTRHLFDGTQVTIRPIRAEDAAMEEAFVEHLSDDSRYYRFMAHLRALSPRKLEYLTSIDYARHMAFVATVQRDGREIEIGGARYDADAHPESCEFAIAVDDAWQGSGVAGMLMATLMEAARANGFKHMDGIVLAGNHAMLKFARQLGFSVRHEVDDRDTLHVAREL